MRPQSARSWAARRAAAGADAVTAATRAPHGTNDEGRKTDGVLRSFVVRPSSRSRLLARLAAEQPRRPEDEHEHEQTEDDHRLPAGADIAVTEGGDQADEQPAQHGAGEVADAAEDG